ncbi:hypothetical protein EUU23_05335 [Sphingorhabdus sp. IMCC26285]|uniref:Lipoprotein n=1 Tax=Sphingorhabdus profundilacus TaxID=2509718 RepID=A0A6I4LYI1_9SPHN|nr:hypothetical protein [Sphingorhabdus profundilacus]MVZ97126.1 hypothetical protein [Sphingorhabdus profundilacus]
MTYSGTSFLRAFPRLTIPLLLGVALALPLAACGEEGANDAAVADLDNQLVGKGSDPEVNAALNDRILVDPDLTDNANMNTVKAATKPLSGATPADSGFEGDASIEALDGAKLMRAPKATVVKAEECTNCGDRRAATLGGLAADQGVTRGKGTCDAKLQYGAGWANRMPAEFPVYPQGRVKEAGGVDGGICDIRVVSFSTSAAIQNVIDYYYTRARKSGYNAEHQLRAGEHVLGGTRDNDGGAYFITFNAKAGGGTIVDIVANNGR